MARRREILRACQAAILQHVAGQAWANLTRSAQADLQKQVVASLRKLPLSDLKRLARGHPDSPRITWNPNSGIRFHAPGPASEQPTMRPPLSLAEMARYNQRGLILHGLDPAGAPVLSPFKHLNRHMAIQGLSGTGKTNYLALLIAQLATEGGPLVIPDPHGDLIREAIPLLPRHRLKDVVYIDPADTQRTWGVNLLQMAKSLVDETSPDFLQTMNHVIEDSVSAIVHALSVIQEDTSGYTSGPSVQSMLGMGALAATERDDTTFVDLYSLLTNPDILDIVVEEIARTTTADYFRNIYSRLNVEYRERVRNKVDPFLQSAMVNLFSRRKECASLKELIEGNKIIFFDLDTRRLPANLSSLIGYILITLVMFVVDRRPSKQEGLKPLYLVVDEFSNVASKSTVRWLAQARKMNAGLIVAYQHLGQLPEDIQAALGNAATKAIFRVSHQDAKLLAPALGLMDESGHSRPEEVSELEDYQLQLLYVAEREDEASIARNLVTVRTLPRPPPGPQDPLLVARVKEVGRRVYARPNNPQDHQTIYTANDAGGRQVLEAIYEATLAIGAANQYRLPSKEPRAIWALANKYVTFSLIAAVLEGKGIGITAQRIGQLRRTLAVRGLVRMRKTTQGLETTELTPAGLAAVRQFLIPGKAQQEGGPVHREAVFLLHQALCKLAPVPSVMPDQRTTTYTPDLVVRMPRQVPQHWLNTLSKKDTIHFHVEEATRDRLSKIASNVTRANGAEADVVVVVYQATPDPQSLDVVGRVEYGIRRHRGASIESLGSQAPAWADEERSWRLWVVTSQAQLLEYQPASHTLVPVEKAYPPLNAAQAG